MVMLRLTLSRLRFSVLCFRSTDNRILTTENKEISHG